MKTEYTPSKNVLLTLKQGGMSKGVITDALRRYRDTFPPYSDSAFESFCFSISGPSESAYFPDNWSPSSFGRLKLQDSIATEYLDCYRDRYKGAIAPSPNLDQHFNSYCMALWAKDSRNPNTLMETFIRMDWRPSNKVMAELIALGIDSEYLEMLILEFCLYWTERNEHRRDWSVRFKKNAILRHSRKNLHHLDH